MPAFPRLILAAILVSRASCALTRHLFNASFVAASGARCLDGSPAGYYMEKGDPSAFVVFLQGGGACFTPADCAARAKTALGSSTYWGSTYTDAANVLSADPRVSPFSNFTRVFVPYCSGDVHLGTRTSTVSSEYPFFFSGHLIVAAVVAELAASPSVALGEARAVLLAGASAGGIGAFVNADFVAAQLPRVADFRAAPQGGWFFPPVVNFSAWVANPNAGPPFAGQDSPAMDLWAAYLPPACVAAKGRAYCASIDFSFPFIKTPLHVVENLADSNQLFVQLGVPHNFSDPAALAYIAAFQDRMRTGLRQVAAAAPRSALFAAACVAHTENLNFAAPATTIQGHTYKDSISNWYFHSPAGTPPVLMDSCDGIACNPTCPPITAPRNALAAAAAAAAAVSRGAL